MSTLFDSLTNEQDKLNQMDSLISSKGKYHALIVQGIKYIKNKIVKEKKPKSGIKDENLKPTNEGSMEKVKKEGSTWESDFTLRINV